MTSRQQFDQWLISLNVGYDLRFCGEYLCGTVQGLWETWQTSRAQLAVELPGQERFTNWAAYTSWRELQLHNLKAAGLQVKQ